MNSRERVLAVLKGEPVDRFPVDFHFADETALQRFAQHYGMDGEALLSYLENDIRHLYVMDEIELFLQNRPMMEYAFAHGFAKREEEDSDLCYDQWGIGWNMASDGQLPVSNPLKEWENLACIKAPNPQKEGEFYAVDAALQDFCKKGLAVDIVQYFGPFEKGYLIRGFENFMMDMYEETENVEMLLDIITDYRVNMAREICRRGVTYGHSGDDYGTQGGPIMSLELWRELFKPRLERIWGVYKENGLPIVHHSCGDCMQFLDEMIDIGLDAIHPVQAAAMDIRQLSKRYGKRLVFYGGFDTQEILTFGTPEQVRENVKETVGILGKWGRIICAPINIMRNVPFENFEALVASVHEYRNLV